MIWFSLLFGLALGVFVEWRMGRLRNGSRSDRASL